ncbi:MAG TPA: PAS domain-containing protein [Thermotogota bacterium]|nr:PAS domain-containing protein [Thermotogota bacterium]
MEHIIGNPILGYARHRIILNDAGKPCDYEFLEVNSAFERLTGMKRENLIGRSFCQAIPCIEQARFDWIGFCGDIALNGGEKEFEHFSEFFGRWYQVYVYSTEKLFFTTLFCDITKSKKKSDELEGFFDLTLDLLCIADINGYFVKTNKAWSEILGYSTEELDKHKFTDFVHPEDLQATLEAMEKLESGDEVLDFTNRYRSQDGSYRYIEWRSHPKGNLIYAAARDVTGRIKAEERLKAERNRLAGIIEGTRSGTWEWNVQTGETVFSERWANIIGYTLEEISPVSIETWKKFAHPEDLKASGELLEKHFCGELDYYECETRMRHKNGEWIWVLGRGKVVSWTDGGKPLMMSGTHQDITDRKRMENALRQSEERLELAMAAKNEGVWDWNLVTNQAFFDDRYYTMAGYEAGEFPQDFSSWTARVHPDDLPTAEAAIKAHLSGESDRFDIDFRFKCKNGSWMWIQGRGKIMERDEAGAPSRMIGTHTDITERKQAEEALRESEAKLSALFASMTEMVALHEVVFNEAGEAVNYRITDCNAAFTRITGIRREDAIGKLANEVYGTPEPPYLSEFTGVGINGKPFHYETYFAPMDKHFSISVVSPGKNRFATITTDISEPKRVQAIIDAKNKELEQLVYVASHDLRSPLVNVDGFSQELDYSLKELRVLLDSDKDIEKIGKALHAEIPEMEKSIGRIRASVSQMDRLLKGLLKLSRFGRVALQIGDIDMNELIAQLAESFSFSLREHGIALTVEKLPDCRGDAVQVTQVFSNLIDNAIKYRHPDRAGRIRVCGEIKMDRAVYRVEDNGIGIAENHLEHVFEIFHRLEPGKTAGEGIGLTIAKQALSRMYGEIRAESQPGKGSAFIVILPPVRNRNSR